MQKNHEISDEVLVVEIRTKDKERYAELVERYQHKLLRYAAYLIHDEQKALDIVQETFIKAYINLNGFDINKKFSSWIYRIVHNEAMNYIKKYKRETAIPEDVAYSSDENVEEEYIKKELQEKAQGCLRQMLFLYSEPLALHYLDEKSYSEISDILRIPMGTVATRINRGKAIMKKLCQRSK